MTKIEDLPEVADDDDFTDEERESKALEEFEDVWETSGNAVLHDMRTDTLEMLGELNPEVAEVFKAMLRYLSLEFLTDRNQDFGWRTEASGFNDSADKLFPLWRKWHSKP